MRRILTIVVTYNEASNIARIVPEILKHLPTSSVLVVDDNSPDGTGDVVRALAARDPRIEILSRAANAGTVRRPSPARNTPSVTTMT